jgi:hypothetical protein
MRVLLSCVLLVLSTLGIAFCQDTNFPSGPQYLMTSGSPVFARSISTPSMTLASPLLGVGASNATGSLIAGAENQTVSPPRADALPQADLFPIFYGRPPANVVEISLPSESSSNLPSSFLDTGIWQVTTARDLRERGYGVTLVEGAAYGRAQTRRANRVYTNADIDRLRSGSQERPPAG